MNTRERFLKIMNFQRADRLPIIQVEGVEGPTMERWHREGLPEGMDQQQYLGMDRLEFVAVDLHMLPRFAVRVLEETADYTIEINDVGIKTRYDKRHRGYLWGYLDHPVKTRRDWEALVERFDPYDPRRLPADWGPEKIRYYNEADHPIGVLLHPFFFRHAFFLMGMERFMLSLHDEPEFVHAMFEQNAQFCLRAVKPVFDAIRVDYVSMAEDMAYKGGTHISPRMYRQYWYPHQQQVMDFLKDRKVPVIGLWNSGNPKQLLPLMIAQGYNMTYPLEDMAGCNVVQMMGQYGQALRYMGNISIHALIRGKEAIRQEVISKVLPLLDTGGYIPAPDDIIPPEVSFENYVYYVELLHKVNAGQAI